MSNHQKRLSVPNSWPVERKESTWTVKAGAGPHGEAGVPLLILLRDVLGYADSTKEARYALNQGTVLVNGDSVADHRRPIGMFDILAFTERDEYYRVFPDEGGRLSLTPISPEAADSRLGKVVGKQQVAGDAYQLTLHDGTTLRVDTDSAYRTKDSLIVDNETKEVVAHFTYEEGALVTAVDGTHAGEIGEVVEITVMPGSGENTVRVDTSAVGGDGEFETVEPYVVVIDENFVEGSVETADAADETDEDVDEEATEADADDEDEDEEATEADADDEDEGGDA